MDQLDILIAEDDSMITMILHELTARLGHHVIATAKTGIEAIEKTKECEPDVIVMDIKMPELDGIDAAKVIMKENPTPIVILTAHSEASFVERASRAGISTYLLKPIGEADLRPALRLAVDRFHEQRTLLDEVSKTAGLLETHTLIEKAKLILAEKYGYSEKMAHRLIQQISRDKNVRIDETARYILSSNVSLACHETQTN